jgi:hypothetical protein
MSDTATLLLALLASTAGMGCFALTLPAHWRQLFAERPQPASLRLLLRVGGAGLLALAFLLCAAADPISMAILVWTMLLTAGAVLVTALLTLQARSARR